MDKKTREQLNRIEAKINKLLYDIADKDTPSLTHNFNSSLGERLGIKEQDKT